MTGESNDGEKKKGVRACCAQSFLLKLVHESVSGTISGKTARKSLGAVGSDSCVFEKK